MAIQLLALGTVETFALSLKYGDHFSRLHVPKTRLAVLSSTHNVLFISRNVRARHRHLHVRQKQFHHQMTLAETTLLQWLLLQLRCHLLEHTTACLTHETQNTKVPRPLRAGVASRFAPPHRHLQIRSCQSLLPHPSLPPQDGLCRDTPLPTAIFAPPQFPSPPDSPPPPNCLLWSATRCSPLPPPHHLICSSPRRHFASHSPDFPSAFWNGAAVFPDLISSPLDRFELTNPVSQQSRCFLRCGDNLE